uniref:Uncharacterized protein n=1 Tax=Glossina austeni TaxID=7395 RepID=A0A1A9VPH7_GLOAU
MKLNKSVTLLHLNNVQIVMSGHILFERTQRCPQQSIAFATTSWENCTDARQIAKVGIFGGRNYERFIRMLDKFLKWEFLEAPRLVVTHKSPLIWTACAGISTNISYVTAGLCQTQRIVIFVAIAVAVAVAIGVSVESKERIKDKCAT